MRVVGGAAVAIVAGSLVAGCSGGSNSGTGRLNNPITLASAVRDSAQHKLATGAAGFPAGTTVSQVSCVHTQRLDYTCGVHLSTGAVQTVQVSVSPGGRSYVVTSGDL
ncbi:MAG: hypothetical protein E6G01_16160 [Actinobacteria bacterium]|nr:MAG: hypothetical protein E6G01_16160 [Actinomycetota bacterium]